MATTTETQPIDLAPFCGDGVYRTSPATPWVRNEWRYATDGRICVRVPAVGVRNTRAPKPWGFPPASELFHGIDWTEAVTPLSDDAMEDIGICKGCHGERPHGCGRCGGSGRQMVLAVEVLWLEAKYVRLLRSLPGIRRGRAVGKAAVLPFTFDGFGQGVVMGVNH